MPDIRSLTQPVSTNRTTELGNVHVDACLYHGIYFQGTNNIE